MLTGSFHSVKCGSLQFYFRNFKRLISKKSRELDLYCNIFEIKRKKNVKFLLNRHFVYAEDKECH